jgi:Predicted transcriptional regulators
MKENKEVGAKVKSIRELQQLTIQDLAERSGLSIESIEHIESNMDIPSLAPLIKISRALGVRLGTFMDDHEELGPVITRKKSTADSMKVNKNMTYNSLSHDKSGRHMEPFLIDIDTAEKSGFVLSTHEGEEFIYVLEGSVEINYGKDTYVLEEGDSIYYDSIVEHHVHAVSGKKAKIIGVIYTPI